MNQSKLKQTNAASAKHGKMQMMQASPSFLWYILFIMLYKVVFFNGILFIGTVIVG